MDGSNDGKRKKRDSILSRRPGVESTIADQ
jgi:hypothetical protein